MVEATRSGDLDRGMDLLARLPEVMPEEAGPYVRLIYEDIRNTLRVPFVNTIFRVLANYPTYCRSSGASSVPTCANGPWSTRRTSCARALRWGRCWRRCGRRRPPIGEGWATCSASAPSLTRRTM